MSENKQPQEFDFFQEALKAFDAPAVQEAPQPTAPTEKAPVPEVQEEILDEQPPKSTPWQRWWPAILCVAVCIALVISFFPREEKSTGRGENWVYGTLSVATDEMLILVDNAGQRWYVELNGLEAPAMPQVGYLSLWVFYNGEPRETDELNCTKRIRASYVCDTNGEKELPLLKYGFIFDRISFDLDEDGKQEQWLLCEGSGLIISSIAPSYADPFVKPGYGLHHSGYRLVALEEDGTEKYDVLFFPRGAECCVFNNKDNKLSVIGALGNTYTSADICLTDGKVTISYEDLDPTKPSTQIPTVQPTLGSEPAQIQFVLEGTNQASDDRTEIINLSLEQTSQLQTMLSSLPWENAYDEAVIPYLGYMTVVTGGDLRYYRFTHDRVLYHNGKCAKLSEKNWDYIMELMFLASGDLTQVIGAFSANVNMGLPVTLTFTESGICTVKAQVTLDTEIGDATRNLLIMSGRYAIIGDYLLVTGPQNDYFSSSAPVIKEPAPQTFVFTINERYITYVQEMSSQDIVDMPRGNVFYSENALGANMRFGLYWTNEIIYGGSNAVSTPDFFVNSSVAARLRALLDQQTWKNTSDSNKRTKTGFFTLQTARSASEVYGSAEIYYFTKDGYLLWNNKASKIGYELWEVMMELLRQNADPAAEVVQRYRAMNTQDETVDLYFYQDGVFECVISSQHGIVGKYVRVGRVLYVYFANASSSLVFIIGEEGIVFNETLSVGAGFDLADGTVFMPHNESNGPAPLTVVFDFSLTSPSAGGVIAVTDSLVLSRTQSNILKDLFAGLQWESEEVIEPLGSMHLSYDDGSEKQYSIHNGNKLSCDDGVATLDEEQWLLLQKLLESSCPPGGIKGLFRANCDEKQYILNCMTSSVELSQVGDVAVNKIAYCNYYKIGNVIFCNSRFTGISFLLLEKEDGMLEYQAKGSGIAELWFPDGQIFEMPTTPATAE